MKTAKKFTFCLPGAVRNDHFKNLMIPIYKSLTFSGLFPVVTKTQHISFFYASCFQISNQLIKSSLFILFTMPDFQFNHKFLLYLN